MKVLWLKLVLILSLTGFSYAQNLTEPPVAQGVAQTEISGKLNVRCNGCFDADHKGPKHTFFIHCDKTNKPIKLDVSKLNIPQSKFGKKIRIKGTLSKKRKANILGQPSAKTSSQALEENVLEASAITYAEEITQASPIKAQSNGAAPVTTELKCLLIFVSALDVTYSANSKNDIKAIMFDNALNVDLAMRETTRGHMGLVLGKDANDTGMVTVNLDYNIGSKSTYALEQGAVTAAATLGFQENDYDRIFVFLPPGAPKFTAYAYYNASRSVYSSGRSNQVETTLHELGHNFGFAHANKYNHSNGTAQEYGDKTCIMGPSPGKSLTASFNPVKQDHLGWFDSYPGSLQAPSSDVTFDIQPNALSLDTNNGVSSVKLESSNGILETYYISYLKGTGNYGQVRDNHDKEKVILYRHDYQWYAQSDQWHNLDVGGSQTVHGVKITFERFSDANKSLATVSFDFPDGNTKPIANDQSLTTNKNTSLPITLTGSDVDSDPLIFTAVTQPTNGTLSGTGANLTYIPNAGYSGLDSFEFKSNDGKISSYATINLKVGTVVSVVATDSFAAEAGQDTGTWTISRTGNTSTSLNVNFTISGTATIGNDYTVASASSIVIPAGQSSVTLKLTPIDDSVFDEGNETITLTANLTSLYGIDTASDTITIIDNDITPIYSLTYSADFGGSISGDVSQDILQGSNASTVTAIADTGYTFSQWSDGLTTASRTDANVTANISVTANFTAETYTVTYVGNGHTGGVVPEDQSKDHAVDLTLAIQGSMVRSGGYVLTGWNTAGDGSGTDYLEGGSYDADADLTLYAQWAISTTLLAEGFESPVVSGYSETTMPDNGKWISSTYGYGATKKGLINKDGGAFSNPQAGNNQGYAFRYGNSGITTSVGAIGSIESNATYKVSFKVVMDTNTADTGYILQLIAFANGDSRNDCRSLPANSIELASFTGNAPVDGSFATVTFQFTADPGTQAAAIGRDLGLRFIGKSSSAIIDDVKVEKLAANNTPVYSVTYNVSSGGSINGVVSQNILLGNNAATVTAVSNQGHSFDQWSDGVITATRTDTNITKNINVTANFNIHVYPVTFIEGANGSRTGGASLFQLVNHGSSATAPDITADQGYTFTGWDVTFNSVTFELTVTAQYSSTGIYTVTYDGNGNSGGTVPVQQTKNHEVDLILASNSGNLVNAQKTFDGWNTAVDGSGIAYLEEATYAINADLTLYAQWSSSTSTSTILLSESFESPIVNGYSQGSIPNNGKWVAANQGYKSISHGLVNKDGGDFTNPSASNHQGYAFRYSNSGLTTSNGAITALEATATYRVSFDVVMDGGSNKTPYMVQLIAFANGAPRNDTRSIPVGSTQLKSFTGNAPADGSIARVSFEFEADTATHTAEIGKDLGLRFIGATSSAIIDNVKVEKTSGNTTPTYSVTYNVGFGGSINGITTQNILQGADATSVTAMPDTSYTFDHWSDGLTTATRTDTNITQNINVTANFLINSYTVTFVEGSQGNRTGGGSLVQTVNHDSAATAPSITANQGYAFSGWDVTFNKVTSDLTVTAQYSSTGIYTVTYDGNGNSDGAVPADQAKNHDVDLILASNSGNLIKSQYTFTGWNTAVDGSGTPYPEGDIYGINADLTLYAQWSSSTSTTLLTESFESPIVSGYSKGSIPNNGKWVAANQGYKGNAHGLINKNGGDFTNPSASNHQGYAFRYTNSGLTTSVGAIGTLEAAVNYKVSFDVVMDGSNNTTPYNVQLIAFANGAPRNDARSLPANSTELKSFSGDAPADGSIVNVSFEFQVDATAHAAEIGKDLGLRFIGANSSAIIDNVIVEKVTGNNAEIITASVSNEEIMKPSLEKHEDSAISANINITNNLYYAVYEVTTKSTIYTVSYYLDAKESLELNDTIVKIHTNEVLTDSEIENELNIIFEDEGVTSIEKLP